MVGPYVVGFNNLLGKRVLRWFCLGRYWKGIQLSSMLDSVLSQGNDPSPAALPKNRHPISFLKFKRIN